MMTKGMCAKLDHEEYEKTLIEPCEDAISREWLIKELSVVKDRPVSSQMYIINNAPRVAPSRPSGKWIESFKKVEVRRGAYLGTKFIHDGWSCSECSEVVEKRYPNCPYCLARMKGADDEM